MSDWTPKAFSGNSTPVQIDEELLDEEVVIFLGGRNIYNDPTYAYIKVTLRNLQKLKSALDAGQNFMPSDFGTVLAAGRGEPSEEIKSEMRLTYNMVDVPHPPVRARPAAPAAPASQPSVWDEE